MTNYYPHSARKSLLELCMLDAFKTTWHEKEEEIKKSMLEKVTSVETSPFAYELFNMNQANQNYKIAESEIFTSNTLLFKNMHDVSPDSFRGEATSIGLKVLMRRDNFYSNHFSVMQVGSKMSYIDAIKFLHQLYMQNSSMIYGALLHDGSKFINPLHPIIAQTMVKKITNDPSVPEATEMMRNKYTVMLYTYKEGSPEGYGARMYDTKFDTIFINQILGSLAMLELKTEKAFKITSFKTLRDMNPSVSNSTFYEPYHYRSFSYEYQTVRTDGSGKQAHDVNIQPVQIINDGIASPYYGITAVKVSPSNGVLGYNLSPMLSCNIGRPYTEFNNDKTNIVVHGANVCTGGLTSSSEAGMLTLNHANLGSPFYSDIVGVGSYRFAELCVKVSLSIYAEYLNLEKIHFMPQAEPQAPISFEEYKKKHGKVSLKQYLSSIAAIS